MTPSHAHHIGSSVPSFHERCLCETRACVKTKTAPLPSNHPSHPRDAGKNSKYSYVSINSVCCSGPFPFFSLPSSSKRWCSRRRRKHARRALEQSNDNSLKEEEEEEEEKSISQRKHCHVFSEVHDDLKKKKSLRVWQMCV